MATMKRVLTGWNYSVLIITCSNSLLYNAMYSRTTTTRFEKHIEELYVSHMYLECIWRRVQLTNFYLLIFISNFAGLWGIIIRSRGLILEHQNDNLEMWQNILM